MNVQSKKQKGRKLQNEIVEAFLNEFSNLTENDIVGTSMGKAGTDIQLSEKALDYIPIDVEAKYQENLNIWGALKQVIERVENRLKNKPEHKQKIPAVIFRRNRTDTFICLKFNDFLKFFGLKKE